MQTHSRLPQRRPTVHATLPHRGFAQHMHPPTDTARVRWWCCATYFVCDHMVVGWSCVQWCLAGAAGVGAGSGGGGVVGALEDVAGIGHRSNATCRGCCSPPSPSPSATTNWTTIQPTGAQHEPAHRAGTTADARMRSLVDAIPTASQPPPPRGRTPRHGMAWHGMARQAGAAAAGVPTPTTSNLPARPTCPLCPPGGSIF